MTTRLKILILICDYHPISNPHTREAVLLDMRLERWPVEIAASAAHLQQVVTDAATVHTNYFTLMGMVDPHITSIVSPIITTPKGRNQLKNDINQMVTTPIVDADFDQLFTAALSQIDI